LINVAFVLNILIIIYGYSKHKDWLNAISVNSSVTILFYLSSAYLNLDDKLDVTDVNLRLGIFYILLYSSCFTVGYLFNIKIVNSILNKFTCYLRYRYNDKKSITKSYELILLAILLMLLTATVGGGGHKWVTEPREAYLHYRSNVGIFYALTQWFLVSAEFFILFKIKDKYKYILTIIAFVAIFYFTGSKNNILTAITIGIYNYNYNYKKISAMELIAYLCPLISLFLIIVQYNQNLSGFSESSMYFIDYYKTTVLYLSLDDTVHLGSGLISSLWQYIPRILMQNKPYVYGDTLITELIYPGYAEMGNTPGMLPYSLAFYDFGFIGVVVQSLFFGVIAKSIYKIYLNQKSNIFIFILYCQSNLFPVFAFQNTLITIFFLILLKYYSFRK